MPLPRRSLGELRVTTDLSVSKVSRRQTLIGLSALLAGCEADTLSVAKSESSVLLAPQEPVPMLLARQYGYPSDQTRITTSGFATDGDGGGAVYFRIGSRIADLRFPRMEWERHAWSFRAADDSLWVLSGQQEHNPAMFGAFGNPHADDTDALQAALDAPMVRTLNIHAVHRISRGLVKPSGKHLKGSGREVSGFVFIPIQAGTQQQNPVCGFLLQDDVGGSASDFFMDIQRSGLGMGDTQLEVLHNRCHGLVVTGASRDVRIERVDVSNATGYAHYTSRGPAGSPTDILRFDCKAINSQVGFETTGQGTSEITENCDVAGTPIDGGDVVPMEAGYHSYGGFSRVVRRNCRFRGEAYAQLSAIVGGVDNGDLVFENCDFESSRYPALATINPDPECANQGRRTRSVTVTGGRFVSPFIGALLNHCTVSMSGCHVYGLLGVQISWEADVSIANSLVVGINPDVDSTVACRGLNVEGNGRAVWNGDGVIAAVHARTVAFAIPYGGDVTIAGNPTILRDTQMADGLVG